MVEYAPPRVYVHDGDGRRLCELVEATGKRSFGTMQVQRATCVIAETDPNLEHSDPGQGRFLVIESSLYGLTWAGPLVKITGGPVSGTIQLEARSYESVVQERFLPTGFTASGASGSVFTQLWEAVERENGTGVSLGEVSAGEPFPDGSYGELSLFGAWNRVAQQTAHEWWLEHAVVQGRLQTSAHFRPARGQDRTREVTLGVGSWAQVRVNDWWESTEGGVHRLRAIAGATGTTQGFTERSRVERRAGKSAPVSTATLVTAQNTRHGYSFLKGPTGDSVLTRREQLLILENVRGSGALATAAESVLAKGRAVQRGADLELQGVGERWRLIEPGDVVRLMLPEPYFIGGYDGHVAVLDTEPVEELGTLRIIVEVADG